MDENNQVLDDYRIDYTRQHIQAMNDSIYIDGIDLIGYTYLSCINVISGGTGEMRKRYVFIFVDKNNDGEGTFNRYSKDSFYWYKNVISTNGEDLGK